MNDLVSGSTAPNLSAHATKTAGAAKQYTLLNGKYSEIMWAGMPIGGGLMVRTRARHGLRLASWRALPDPVAFLLGGIGAQFHPPGGACLLVADQCVYWLAGA
jgi:hypothetical protein